MADKDKSALDYFKEVAGLSGGNESDRGDRTHYTAYNDVTHFSWDEKQGKYVEGSFHETKAPGTKGGGFLGKILGDKKKKE